MRNSFSSTFALLLSGISLGCAGPSGPRSHLETESERAAEMKQMREEITREILAELQTRESSRGQEVSRSLQTTESGSDRNPEQENDRFAGSVSGRILLGGQGLAECKVKLVRLPSADTLFEAYTAFKEGREYEAVTNEDGIYIIANIPAGPYCLKWLPKGETGWIRKLSEKPDILVQAGSMTHFKDIDLGKINVIPK